MAQPTPVTPRNNPSHAMLHNEHVNVKNFGAIGDGTTDDTAAITAAIAAGSAAKSPVFFPPTTGSYKVASTISLNSYAGTWLLGGGAQGNTGGGAENGVLIGAASSVSPVFSFTTGGTANLTFENLRFYAPGCAVKISDSANVWFKNCEFTATDTAGTDNCGVLLENTFWAWFERCHFYAASTASGEGAVILRGKEPSPNVDHCYLIFFKDCRFWYQGVYYHDQNDVAVDAAHAEFITFEDIQTENFASTSALIEFTKTASTNWGGRYIMYPRFKNIAFYDYTGTPAVVRSSVPNGMQLAVAEDVLAPRLFEFSTGTVYRSFVAGFTINTPVVDGSGASKAAAVFQVNDGAYARGMGLEGDLVNIPGVSGAKNQITIPDTTSGAGMTIGGDTNLYRVSANALQSDDQFLSASFLTANNGGANVLVVGATAPATAGAGLSMGSSLDTNLYRSAANTLQTDDVLRDHKGTPAYSASITPNATDGDWQTITVTNATAFTINAPTNPPDSTHSQELTIEIFNNSGGAHGAITWNAAFVLVGGALAVIANTKKKFIAFKWNGASWIETSRASADY